MMRYRKATMDDVELLRRWDEDPSVVDSDPMGEWNWEAELSKDPDWREFLIAETAGVAIGFLQIIDPELEETHYWGDTGSGFRAIDIWIGSPLWRNKGYGTLMMHEALRRCFAPPDVHTVLIDPLESNVGARRFYERLGFEFVENRMFDDDACAVYQMTRSRWQEKALIPGTYR